MLLGVSEGGRALKWNVFPCLQGGYGAVGVQAKIKHVYVSQTTPVLEK